MKRPPKSLWFRAKEYGWGWYPLTWQGWAVTVVFALVFALSFVLFMSWLAAAKGTGAMDTRSLLLGISEFAIWMTLLTGVLIRICYKKGEKPGWRWGKKD